MWISTFWGFRVPPCTNKAIICIICHSGSFPTGFPPNGPVIQFRSFFYRCGCCGYQKRNFNEAILFPSDRERAPQPITAQLSSQGDTSFLCSLVFIFTNDMVCFLIKPFIVHLHSEYCNFRQGGLSSYGRNGGCRCRSGPCLHAF